MNVDSLRPALDATADGHGPGLFGLVTENGSVVFEGAAGQALTARHRFRIGSVTKTFTAALVLHLADDGLLALDDPLPRWLPGLVPDADAITVDVLLRMRSGLPDYTGPLLGDPPALGTHEARDPRSALQRYWSPEQLIEVALAAPGRIPAGRETRYCSTDHILLGLIVERATGQRFDAQLWQRIIQPLGLTDTELPTVDPHIRGEHVDGHVRGSAGEPYVTCTTLSPSEAWAAGGMISSARDLATFLDGMPCRDRMTTVTDRLDSWRSRTVGMLRYEKGGTVAFGQHGGAPGFTTLALRTTTGRCIVLWQNGIDLHDVLTSDNPFIQTALS